MDNTTADSPGAALPAPAKLDGKTAIVTGAAGGIGAATVAALLAVGAQVIGVDRDAAGLDRLARSYPSLIPLTGDMSDPALDRQIADCLRHNGCQPDILVNNAGIGGGAPASETSDEQLMSYIDINLVSVFRLSRWAVQAMAGRGGSIINTASIFAVVGAQNASAYSMTKAGVAGLTRQMAVDYGPSGIRVNAVAPGLIRTPLTEERIHTEEYRRKIFVEQSPLQRLGQPSDIANVIRFLASDDAAFMTGQILEVDGGWAMGRFPREAPL